MSEPQVDTTTPSFLLDGDLPRLGGSAPTPPAPPTTPAAPTPSTTPAPSMRVPTMPPPTGPASHHGPSPLFSAPGAAPLLGSPDLSPRPTVLTEDRDVGDTIDAPALPSLPSAAAPVLPTSSPMTGAAPDAESNAGSPVEVEPAARAEEHPMAHLMPQKTAPNEASKRAAELRAAKKAKARKIKIGVGVAALVVAVLAGPPLYGWVTDALNDAGSTTTVDE